MPLTINTNVPSIGAQRHLGLNTFNLNKSMEKLASGFRINRAGDDAAGLQLSENLRAQIRGSKKALANVQDGINVLNIADGAYDTITSNLQRMRELAVQAANDTYDANARTAIQAELDQLALEITRISDSTAFNGINLLDGSAPATAMILQIGANNGPSNEIALGATGVFNNADAAALGVGALNVSSHANAIAAITSVDGGLTTVNGNRGIIGAVVNRLEGSAQNLQISIENLSASESRIRDVDVAAESATLVRNQILQQASSAMLSQANQAPSLALQLLQ